MRTVFGSVALCVGGLLVLLTLLGAVQSPAVAPGVCLASGGLAAVLVIASFLLLRGKKPEPAGRRVILLPSLGAGLAALILAIGSKDHALGKYCGIEAAGNHSYRLLVRVLGTVLHDERGQAVQRQEAGNTITGPPPDLETRMACWEFGLDAAAVAGGAFLGGLLGIAIRLLTRAPAKAPGGKAGDVP